MEAVSAEMFGGASGRRSLTNARSNSTRRHMPARAEGRCSATLLQSAQQFYNEPARQAAGWRGRPRVHHAVHRAEEAVTSGENVAYNGYAHSFAGMGVQFILFMGSTSASASCWSASAGLWKRLRSAPLSRACCSAATSSSGAIIALDPAGLIVRLRDRRLPRADRRQRRRLLGDRRRVRAHGVAPSACYRRARPDARGTRGLAIFATLMMVMLGGAWVPSFIFPAWLQTAHAGRARRAGRSTASTR